MESAFGVDHGEVSKGVPKGLVTAAEKYAKHPGHLVKQPSGGSIRKPDQKLLYASERLKAHTEGKAVRGIKAWKEAKLPQANYPHSATETMTRGHRARMASRTTLSGGY